MSRNESEVPFPPGYISPWLQVEEPCAVGCMLALEKFCYCRCGGKNHGKAKVEFAGYFCEGCGMSFGKDPNRKWVNGCWGQCGISRKYRSRAGYLFTSAHWCQACGEGEPFRRFLAR